MTPESCQSGTDRIAFAAHSIPDATIVVNVQGDEPLMEPAMNDEAIRPLLEDPLCPVGTLVRRIDSEADLTNPGTVKVVISQRNRCLYFSRAAIPFGRDRAPADWLRSHIYYKHIGLYVFRREFLLRYAEMKQTPLEVMEKLEQLRILEHGYSITAAITTHDSVPVDTAHDLDRVRAIARGTP
jgi:3-deoxy-manno-octulosonate cytidylyltransferase (CMP-KDO synthetase)